MKFLKRTLRVLLVLGIIVGILFLARRPIMRGFAYWLVVEDEIQAVDAVFVLSGNAAERCPAAADVFERGMTPLVITTGESVNPTLVAAGTPINDAEVGRLALLELGVDSSAIRLLSRGTSTFEESEEILGYSLAQGFERIMIVSSKLHTRRIGFVFRDKFKENGIEVVVHGATPRAEDYTLDEWWAYETGLIFLNNEYIKLVYYWLKY